jgi:hypothetical protein
MPVQGYAIGLHWRMQRDVTVQPNCCFCTSFQCEEVIVEFGEGEDREKKDNDKERRKQKGRKFAFNDTISCFACFNLAKRLI